MGRYTQCKRRGSLTRQAATVVQTPPVYGVDWDVQNLGTETANLRNLGNDPYGVGFINFRWAVTGAPVTTVVPPVETGDSYELNTHGDGDFDFTAAWSNGVSDTSAVSAIHTETIG